VTSFLNCVTPPYCGTGEARNFKFSIDHGTYHPNDDKVSPKAVRGQNPGAVLKNLNFGASVWALMSAPLYFYSHLV